MVRHAHPFPRAAGLAIAASILFSLSSCQVAGLFGSSSTSTATTTTTTPLYKTLLYMTDTNSGKVYTYDPATQKANATSLVATGLNSTGTITFYGGKAFAAVGYGTGAGVYWFDPSATSPTFAKLATPANVALNAQYFAFANSTLAYVSIAGSYSGDTGGIYTFNPSNLGAGLSGPLAGTDKYLQEIAIGPDGKVYAAEYLDQKVLVYDPVATTTTTIVTSASGTTGVRAGAYNGQSGVFVANTGPYGSIAGSIDFIASNATTAVTLVAPTAAAPVTPGRIIQLATSSNLVATGNGHTWLVTLSGAAASVKEITSTGTSFGSLDLTESLGLIYVPTDATSDYVHYTNYLYVFNESGTMQSYSPVSVMTSADGFTNLAFYQ